MSEQHQLLSNGTAGTGYRGYSSAFSHHGSNRDFSNREQHRHAAMDHTGDDNELGTAVAYEIKISKAPLNAGNFADAQSVDNPPLPKRNVQSWSH